MGLVLGEDTQSRLRLCSMVVLEKTAKSELGSILAKGFASPHTADPEILSGKIEIKVKNRVITTYLAARQGRDFLVHPSHPVGFVERREAIPELHEVMIKIARG